MVKVRINREFATLVRYCEGNRGSEWICVRPPYDKYHANVWEIWQHVFDWRKRTKWQLVTYCGSWANMSDKWEQFTGEFLSFVPESNLV